MYLGDFPTGQTINCFFTTHTSLGGATAALSAFENSDCKIYKDNSATPRNTATGTTMTSPFNSITGLHLFSIDTSDNSDAGFFAAGHSYTVVLSPDTETVDGQTVVAIIARFSIDNRGLLRPATAMRTLVVDANGLADANVVKVGPTGSGTAQTARDLGLALPAAAPAAAGGLLISAAGTTGAALDTALGRLDAAVTSRLAPTVAARTLDIAANGGLDSDAWANLLATTIDGVAFSTLMTMLLAVEAGKAQTTDLGSTRRITYKKQDGSTVCLTVVVSEADGSRAATATPA